MNYSFAGAFKVVLFWAASSYISEILLSILHYLCQWFHQCPCHCLCLWDHGFLATVKVTGSCVPALILERLVSGTIMVVTLGSWVQHLLLEGLWLHSLCYGAGSQALLWFLEPHVTRAIAAALDSQVLGIVPDTGRAKVQLLLLVGLRWLAGS